MPLIDLAFDIFSVSFDDLFLYIIIPNSPSVCIVLDNDVTVLFKEGIGSSISVG